MPTVSLPTAEGVLENYAMSPARQFNVMTNGAAPRVAYAAAHVVADPLTDCDPWIDTAIDWDKTIAYRHYLWSLGLGVAEAMDTAQRGGGVDWPSSLELIERSIKAARAFTAETGRKALLASGAGTDHLSADVACSIDEVIAAYELQCAAIERAGGRIVLMASRALAASATSPDDYARVYDRILSQVKEPVIIHWLGDMFDPALAGYWGHDDLDQAMAVCLGVLAANAGKVDGIKISLLDDDKELAMRKRLPAGVAMYTGDDFNFAKLIAGDEDGYSDALLGIFDSIAPAASAALQAMSRQDMDEYWRILEPMVPLSRHIFQSPTRFYKTGVVFLAYLNGHQDHFTLVGGQESARSNLHLAELFRLADKAGLLRDPDLAAGRMTQVMSVRGIGV
jgi:hypothetical protein